MKLMHELAVLTLKSPSEWFEDWREKNIDKTIIKFSYKEAPVKGGYSSVEVKWESDDNQ